MNLPNLPTDNLYKFIALAGLAIIFFSVVLPSIALHNLRLELLKTNGELNVLKAESDYLQAECAKENMSPEERAKVDEKRKEINLKLIQLKSKDEAEWFLHRQTIVWQSAASIGLIVGAVMVIFGFKLWYERVQKYQDIILRKEAGELPDSEIKETQHIPPPSETGDSPSASSASG